MMKIFLLGAWRFFRFAAANTVRRVLIALAGIIVGFIGPILALSELPKLFGSNDFFWNDFASLMNKEGSFRDVLLACMPAAFLCVTDLAAHILDDDFRYSRSRLCYQGLFLLELVVLISACFLIAGYVGMQAANSVVGRSWVAQFEYAWPMSKLLLAFTITFEVLLAWVESVLKAENLNWKL